jgi:ribosomal protein L15
MGGQRQLMQAVPKLKGFKTLHAAAEIVYLEQLNALSGEVDNFVLAKAGMISSPFVKAKVIVRGELKSEVELKTQAASKTAIEAIKQQGGKFEKVGTPKRPAQPADGEVKTK